MAQSDPEIIMPPATPTRRMSIKGLVPSLPERGKVKIGMLGVKRRSEAGNEYGQPIRLDYFRVTTMERGGDGNFVRDETIHAQIGDKPTEIPVRLLYDDIELNFPTRYAAYYGRTLWCSGDGERASRLQKDKTHKTIGCPCPLADPSYSPEKGQQPACKMNASLSVIIDGCSGLGGVWKFRTTGFNSISSLLGTLQFLQARTGGLLANIPFKLQLRHKQGTNPKDGTPVNVRYVTLEYEGNDQELQEVAYQIALRRETLHISIREIEAVARRHLQLTDLTHVPLPGDETEDVVDEFFPEQANGEAESFADGPPTRAQFRQQQQPETGAPTSLTASEEVETRDARESQRQDGGTARQSSESRGSSQSYPKPVEATDPESKPPEGRDAAPVDGARSSSEAKAGQTAPAAVQEVETRTSVHGKTQPRDSAEAGGSPAPNSGSWHVTNPEDGEVQSYDTAAEAEMAFTQLLNEGMRKAMHAKPGTLLAKSLEIAIEANGALIKVLPQDVFTLLSGKIDAALEEVANAHAGAKVASAQPKQSDDIAEALKKPAANEQPEAEEKASPLQSRDLNIKPVLQPIGPGRGNRVNWEATAENTIALILEMTAEELAAFPNEGVNARHIAQFKLLDSQSRQVGSAPQYWVRVVAAMEERAKNLGT